MDREEIRAAAEEAIQAELQHLLPRQMNRGSDNGRYPTWKWLTGILIVALFGMTSFVVGGNLGDAKADTKEIRIKLDEACNRVTKLETDISYIKSGMEEQKALNERVNKVMIRVEKTLKITNGD